jgi:hypothetical protein
MSNFTLRYALDLCLVAQTASAMEASASKPTMTIISAGVTHKTPFYNCGRFLARISRDNGFSFEEAKAG